MVAAPLIVLSRPWMSMWRALPLRVRRPLARTVMRSRYLAPLRAAFGMLARPYGAWIAFNANLVFWHLPGPYDATLRNIDVHALEHTTFLLFGIVFWAQVVGTSPASRRLLTYAGRIVYTAAAMVINVGLSIYLAFAQHPLYNPYALLAHRPGGISALADQQIGAGIMWTAGDMPFAIAIALLVQLILGQHETMSVTGPREDDAPQDTQVRAGSA